MYITVEDYKTWADARGYTYPADDAEISAAIAIATDFIDFNYSFKGTADDNQELQLPTDQVSIADIERGAAQAVYQQLLGRLVVVPTELSQKGQVVSESKGLGSLSTSTSYAEGYQYTSSYPTPMIDRALRPYTIGGGLGTTARW